MEWDIQLTSAQNTTISPSQTSGVGREISEKPVDLYMKLKQICGKSEM